MNKTSISIIKNRQKFSMIEKYNHRNTNFLQEQSSNSKEVVEDAKLQVGSFQIKLIRVAVREMKTGIISRGQCTETDADQIADV